MIRALTWLVIDDLAVLVATTLCVVGLVLLPKDDDSANDARWTPAGYPTFRWAWAEHYWNSLEYISAVGLSAWLFRHYCGKGEGGNDDAAIPRAGYALLRLLP